MGQKYRIAPGCSGGVIMMEWFDMGKYDFYVWTSIGVFVVGLLLDYINCNRQHKALRKNILAKQQRKQQRSQNS